MNGILRFAHEAELGEFLIRLLDLGQQRAGRHRHHGVLRDVPAELFHDFKAHALRAFGVVGRMFTFTNAQPNLPAISAQSRFTSS